MLLKGLKKGLAEDKGQSGTLSFVSKPQGKCQLSVKIFGYLSSVVIQLHPDPPE